MTTGALSQRLARLERAAGVDAPPRCPECGLRPGEPEPGPVVINCPPPRLFGTPAPAVDTSKDNCVCGRRLVVRLTVPPPGRRRRNGAEEAHPDDGASAAHP